MSGIRPGSASERFGDSGGDCAAASHGDVSGEEDIGGL
jgi:hypothetical protein